MKGKHSGGTHTYAVELSPHGAAAGVGNFYGKRDSGSRAGTLTEAE